MTNPIRMKNKDWSGYLGVSESQHSRQCDSQACVSFSACHVIESQIQFLTGQKIKLSPRFLASVSGTTTQGNSLQAVYNAILEYGICTEDTWPLPVGIDWTWEEFYKSPPKEAYDEALWFKQQWNIDFQSHVSPNSLVTAPLWTLLDLGSEQHIVEQINFTTELDTEPSLAPPGHGGDEAPYLKPLGKVINYNLLLLTPKTMSNVEFVHKAGTNEYGFYFPKLSIDALKDMALNTGINILNADGSINFNSAKEIQGL